MRTLLFRILIPLVFIPLFHLGCQPPTDRVETQTVYPALLTKADSVAMRALAASGGPEAWDKLPFLRFDFAFGNADVRRTANSHLWNRLSGDYRLEMPRNDDTTYVILFNVHSREGAVYLNGTPLDSLEAETFLARAYRSFINDSYWLLMPVKLFDPGVHRSYVPDSSSDLVDVIQLTFGEVGLTPGDTYWVSVEKATGRVIRWTYRLQGWEAGRRPGGRNWIAYKEFNTEHGPIYLSEQKVAGESILFTDRVEVPRTVAEDLFTDPKPRL